MVHKPRLQSRPDTREWKKRTNLRMLRVRLEALRCT
jgi:hypothetical protein